MDKKTALWAAVLTRMAVGYPLSPYGKMGRDDIQADAVIWADEMRHVPASAIDELYRRTVEKRAKNKKNDASFPPNIGDFRATWLDPEWDYWADQNDEPEKRAPVLALPTPAPDLTAPGARTAIAQGEFMRKHGYHVCCHCINQYGLATTAALTIDGSEWVCYESKCDFSLPSDAEVPEPPAPDVEAVRKRTQEELATTGLTSVEKAALECGFDLIDLSAHDAELFRDFYEWFRARYECSLNVSLYTEMWDRWAREKGHFEEKTS